MNKLITTSWDDGHPLDFRVAELLEKYHLKGTFYIPRSGTGHEIMSEAEIAVLSRNFEIGGHTLKHINLLRADQSRRKEEIVGCHQWLSNITGEPPLSFCPPFGAFNQHTHNMITSAGFQTIRTTELLATQIRSQLQPTTLQIYPHSAYTYTKHLLIRGRLPDLSFWLGSGRVTDLLHLTDIYLELIAQRGGCFHLWGHSWEIEKFALWGRLESVLRRLSHRSGYSYVENKDLKR